MTASKQKRKQKKRIEKRDQENTIITYLHTILVADVLHLLILITGNMHFKHSRCKREYMQEKRIIFNFSDKSTITTFFFFKLLYYTKKTHIRQYGISLSNHQLTPSKFQNGVSLGGILYNFSSFLITNRL